MSSAEAPRQDEADKTEEAASEGKPKSIPDPSKIDQSAEDQMRKKYGFKKGPSTIAQRKITSTGGKQYFDSGDYNMSNRKDKQEIASYPHARNPSLAHMRPVGLQQPAQPSKLAAAGGIGKKPLAE